MLSVKMAGSLLKAFFRPEVDSDVNMPQTGLFCLLENRKHV